MGVDPAAVWHRISAAIRRFFSQGPSRKILRRRLILFSVLPALLVLAVAVKLLMMVSYGSYARSDFGKYDAPGLAQDVRKLKSINVIDSYKPYFAEGDRYVLEGKLAEARGEFTTSLSLVDPEDSCPVRINLEVVLEALGDLKSADKHRDQAKPLWQEALKVVQEAPGGCFDTKTEPDEARRKHLNETEKRLQDKLKDPENPPPSDGGGGGGGSGGGGGQGGGGGGQGGQGSGQGGQDSGGPGGPGQPDQANAGQGNAGLGSAGQQGQEGQAPAGQDGQDSQAPGGEPGQPVHDTVGADRIATDGGGVATHQLNPGQGDPSDVLKRLLEDSSATGTDRE